MKSTAKLLVALPVVVLAGVGCLLLLWAYDVSMWATEPDTLRDKGAL